MEIPIYQVDAFTRRLFHGNPAAVCPLHTWPTDAVLHAIAGENNLSETAFFAPEAGGYRLRWFTPAVEVDLCGHATLASAFVIMTRLRPDLEVVRFSSKSGPLTVRRDADRFVLDFPARPPTPCEAPAGLIDAVGGAPTDCLVSRRDHVLVYGSEAEVRALSPSFSALRNIDHEAVVATAPGDDCDFVSRFFCPRIGIDEDPVTGSAHCTLAPYWAARFDRQQLEARQISARGGALSCALRGDRVQIAGHAVLYMQGFIRTRDTDLNI